MAHHRRDRGQLNTDVYNEAVVRGLYGAALRRWLDHFPPDQILVQQYESCVADPTTQLTRTQAFLGLESFTPEAVANPVNRTTSVIELDAEVRRRLSELYRADVCALFELVPDLDLRLWPNFSNLVP